METKKPKKNTTRKKVAIPMHKFYGNDAERQVGNDVERRVGDIDRDWETMWEG